MLATSSLKLRRSIFGLPRPDILQQGFTHSALFSDKRHSKIFSRKKKLYFFQFPLHSTYVSKYFKHFEIIFNKKRIASATIYPRIRNNPLMPSGSFNICCPRDCVSRTANEKLVTIVANRH